MSEQTFPGPAVPVYKWVRMPNGRYLLQRIVNHETIEKGESNDYSRNRSAPVGPSER